MNTLTYNHYLGAEDTPEVVIPQTKNKPEEAPTAPVIKQETKATSVLIAAVLPC